MRAGSRAGRLPATRHCPIGTCSESLLRSSDAFIKWQKIERIPALLCALPTVCPSALRTEAQVWLPRVTAGRGAAVTLPAKRGTIRFAVTAGMFFGHDELWSSSIVMSLTE